MKTVAITLSKGYVMHVTLTPVAATGYCHLAIETQWGSAKDPNERQTRYQVTLPADALPRIAHLFEGVEQ